METIQYWKRRAEAAEAKLADLANNSLIDHLENCSSIVESWPEWKKKGSDATKFIQDLDEFEIGYLNGHMAACKSRPAPAADLAELVPDEFTTDEVPCAMTDVIQAEMDGWNACRAAILRNIEEAK